jgi:hypothetical protein
LISDLFRPLLIVAGFAAAAWFLFNVGILGYAFLYALGYFPSDPKYVLPAGVPEVAIYDFDATITFTAGGKTTTAVQRAEILVPVSERDGGLEAFNGAYGTYAEMELRGKPLTLRANNRTYTGKWQARDAMNLFRQCVGRSFWHFADLVGAIERAPTCNLKPFSAMFNALRWSPTGPWNEGRNFESVRFELVPVRGETSAETAPPMGADQFTKVAGQ